MKNRESIVESLQHRTNLMEQKNVMTAYKRDKCETPEDLADRAKFSA